MPDWILNAIGVSDEIRSHIEHATVALQRPVVWWLGLVILVPVGWFIYRRQRMNLSTVPTLLRVALSVTRILILAILLLVLAGPYLKLDQQIEKRPIVAFVFDHSQSMALAAGPFNDEKELLRMAQAAGYEAADGKIDPETRKVLNRIGRAKLAENAVQARRKELLEPLTKKYDLRFYTVSRQMERMAVGEDLKLPESEPKGTATHLGDAVSQLVEEAAGNEIAGIVLLTDGVNTGGRSIVEAARAAREASAPVFTVPPGSEAPVRDLSLVDVFAPDLVSMGDTVRVAVTLELQGYKEAPVKVQLFEDEAKEPIDTKDLVLKSTEQQHVDLTFEAKKAGAHTMTVKLVPGIELPEDLKENNSDSLVVRVSEDKLKVLYVEGLPRWQFRFLKNAMRRDHGLGGKLGGSPDIVLETEVRRLPPATQKAVLPVTTDELAKYHTVILGDVSPALLDSKFVELLAEGVRDRGLGLIVATGPQSMPHRFDRRLTDLFPVRMRAKAAGIPAPVYKPFRMDISSDGAIHESMRLYDDLVRNESAWSQMPPFYWCAAVERPAAGATVLAYNPAVPSVESRGGKLPLVAHHYAGQGKVMFVGTDSTWLWRQNVGDRFFYKFWGQAIRFVARRSESELKNKSWLEVRPVRAQPGEQTQIELMAFSPDGAPRQEPKMGVQLIGAGASQRIELTADRAVSGRYTAKYIPEASGHYRIGFEPGGESKKVEAHLEVTAATEEMRRPNIDMKALAQIGKVVKLDELDSIAEELKGEARTIPLHREASIWDNWIVLGLLITIYCLDVGLRRLAGLS